MPRLSQTERVDICPLVLLWVVCFQSLKTDSPTSILGICLGKYWVGCFAFIGLVDDVFAIGVDGEGVASGFVECSLPPIGVGVGVPAESIGGKLVAVDAEDADLLVGKAGEGLCAACWGEEAVVGVHGGLYVELAQIESHERDVADGVVLAFACAADVGDLLLRWADVVDNEACGFGQVVVFLLLDGVDEVGVLLPDVGGKRVAVAHDGVGDVSVGKQRLCGFVAADNALGLFQDAKCYGVGGVVSCGEDDGVISCFHLKYPSIAMMKYNP